MSAVEVSAECYERDSWDGDTMNRLTDIEHKLMATKRGSGGGGIN